MGPENAFFQLQVQEDGTYVKLFPAVNGGKDLYLESVLTYFRFIQLENYDKTAIMKGLQSGGTESLIKISGEQISLIDETFYIQTDKEELQAIARFYPPAIDKRNGVSGKLLTKEKILNELGRYGVKAGILETAIDEFIKERKYNTDISLAKGTRPVQGKNGFIEYHFKINQVAHPKINDDGTVDYRHLDLIEHVNQGQKLATIHPAVPGKNGLLISGKVVLPAKIKTPRFKHGKNIFISEDGFNMYAEVAGHVYLIDEKVFVSNTYEVLGNVDASTGDIDYNGDIHVKGNVTSGFSVKATGQVVVDGVVEGSYIEAEGPVIIKGGFQGMGKGVVKAGASVTAKFIENARVESGCDVLAEAILHSNVYAKRKIEAKGKKGLIIGGEIKAGENVTFKVAGSAMGAFTLIEVGLDPMVHNEYHEMEEKLKKYAHEKSQLAQIVKAFKQKLSKGIKFNESQVQTIRTISTRLKEIEMNTNEILGERSNYEELIVNARYGNVVVEDKVFTGVKIVISNAVMITKSVISYCRLEKSGEDVVIKPY